MPAGGYIILKGFRGDFRGYQLTSVRMEDAAPIMKWRNEQISALRQTSPLSETEQNTYFQNVVKPSFSQKQPDIVLLRFTYENNLIGYGGLVHINWTSMKAEVSFLLETERGKDTFQYGRDCSIFLNLLMRCNAAVPLEHTIAWSTPILDSNAFSNSGTRGPCVKKSEDRVLVTKEISSSFILCLEYGIKSIKANNQISRYIPSGIERFTTDLLQLKLMIINRNENCWFSNCPAWKQASYIQKSFALSRRATRSPCCSKIT